MKHIIVAKGVIDGITEEDGKLTLTGYASTFKPLRNGNAIIPKDELEKAMPVYMQRYALILKNHNNEMPPVGKVVDYSIDENGLYIEAEIYDKATIEEIKQGMWKGFSVGGFGKIVPVETSEDGLKHVVDFDLVEISIVSIPADAGAIFEVKNATPTLTDIKNAVNFKPAEKTIVINMIRNYKEYPYSLDEEWNWDWKSDADAIIEKLGWEGLAKACAYVEKEDGKLPEKKEAYKLPYAKLIDGKLTIVYGGVVAALRRLPQANIPEDKKEEIRKHLQNVLDWLKKQKEKQENKMEVENMATIKDEIVEIKNSFNKEVETLYSYLRYRAGITIGEEEKQRLSFAYLETDSDKAALILPEYEKQIFVDAINVSKMLSLFPSRQVSRPEIHSFYMKNSDGSESILPYLNPVDAPASHPVSEYPTYLFEEKITKMGLYAGIFRISELLLQDLPSFYDFIPTLKSIISVALSNTIDKLLADTLNSYTASDVLMYVTVSDNLPNPDDLAKGIDTLEAMNGGNMVFIMHPNTKHYYRTLKTNDGYYRFINPITGKEFTMFGIPVIADTHIDENKVFLVDTKQTFEILHYKGLSFEPVAQGLDEATRFLKTFRFSARLGLMKRFGKIIVWEKTTSNP